MWLIDDDAFLQVDPKHPDRSGLKTRLKSAQKRLQKASKDGTLTLMVGNGISLNAVYEARHLLAGTRNSAKAKSWNEVVEGQFKNLFGAAPPTLNPLIMAQAIARRKGRNGLLRAIERGTKKTIPCHLHRLIAELKPRYIVTTNYDSLLEEALPMCSCYVRARRVSHGRATPEIIKMHGSFAPGRRTDVARLYPGFSRSDANKSIVISETDYDKCTGELIRKGRNNTPLWRALTRTLLIIGKGVLWEDLSFMWALRQRAQMKIAGKKCGPAWWLVDSSISGDRLLTLQNLDIVPIQMGFPVQKDPNGAHHYFANVEAFRRLFGTRLKKALEHNATIDKKKWDTTRRRLVKAPNVVAIGLTALNTVGYPNTEKMRGRGQAWWGTTPLPREGRQNLSLDRVEDYAGGPALTALSVCAALCASRKHGSDSVRCALVSIIGNDDAGKKIRTFCEDHEIDDDAIVARGNSSWRSIVLVHGCQNTKAGTTKTSRGQRVFLDVKGALDVSTFSVGGYRQMKAMLDRKDEDVRAVYIDKWFADKPSPQDPRASRGFLSKNRDKRFQILENLV